MVDFRVARNISRLAAVQLMYEKDLLNTTTDLASSSFSSYMKQEAIYNGMHSRFYKKLVSHFSDNIDFNGLCAKHIANTAPLQQSKIIESIVKVAIIETANTKTPLPIIINEYIEIAKDFATLNEARMLNAMLDRILKNIERPQCDG